MIPSAGEYQTWSSTPSGGKRAGGWVALGLLVIALAACQPGGGSTASNPAPLAPIHVPKGYQGFIEVTFRPTTTYEQALAVLQSAGLQAEVQCAGPGPTVDPPTQTSQQGTFNQTHQLSAVGIPKLTTAMLAQVASAPQVVSVGVAPKVACPDEIGTLSRWNAAFRNVISTRVGCGEYSRTPHGIARVWTGAGQRTAGAWLTALFSSRSMTSPQFAQR